MGSVKMFVLKANIMLEVAVITLLILSFQALDAKKSCSKTLRVNEISDQYPMFVAHGSHSLTLNDIRAFFKPTADENNGISVVNFNLTEDILLPNAPLVILDNKFSSSALFALDHVLSHMEDNEYDIKNGNALDRIAHALHMQETWADTFKFFRKLKREKPSKLLCSCLDRVYGSWITKSLLYIAKQIREPENMYTNSAESNGQRRPYRGNYGGGCCINIRQITDLRSEIRQKEEAIPNIVNEETWKTWKNAT